MIICSKCGRKLGDNDVFCPSCGQRLTRNTEGGSAARAAGNTAQNHAQHAESRKADPNSVQYVYVNKKTGKITNNPHVKTGSEGCLQYVLIAFVAVAVVIIMVAGSVLLTDYLSDNHAGSFMDDEEMPDVTSQSEVSSWEEVSSEVSSESVSSQVSSQEVSSEPSIPEEQTAKYLNRKIKGKWETDVPYKNMSLPGTFEFDGKGHVICTIKAFLFSKKFDGTYQIMDGGRCTLTVNGLDEYTDDDTMVGNLVFVNDNKLEFTVDDTVWKLNRLE